ncbi:methylmalonate-semialdehyde dehydrogenase (CoA acylating), partial [Acinetobacter baumannii]|nr:methylmalonate-semialdehyde dehydrogenase (CoA acylating) [Acinetobacter baumannii]
MSQIVGHFINGEVVVDESNTQPVFNPSTGEISKQVSLGGAKTIDEAVASAKAAF